MKRVIEILSVTDSPKEAQQMYIAQQAQEGFLGGRILFPSDVYPRIRVQTFHEDSDLKANMRDWLPDQMRRVLITAGLARECGFSIE
jgi:hypothetical protein